MSWEFSLRFAALVVLAAAGILGVYDLLVFLRYGTADTISHGVYLVSLRHPFIRYVFVAALSFTAGFFTCHFFGAG